MVTSGRQRGRPRVERDVFTHIAGFAPRSLPTNSRPQNLLRADQTAEPRASSLLRPSDHHSVPLGPQTWELPSKQLGMGVFATEQRGRGSASPARLRAAPSPRKGLRGCGAGGERGSAGRLRLVNTGFPLFPGLLLARLDGRI